MPNSVACKPFRIVRLHAVCHWACKPFRIHNGTSTRVRLEPILSRENAIICICLKCIRIGKLSWAHGIGVNSMNFIISLSFRHQSQLMFASVISIIGKSSQKKDHSLVMNCPRVPDSWLHLKAVHLDDSCGIEIPQATRGISEALKFEYHFFLSSLVRFLFLLFSISSQTASQWNESKSFTQSCSPYRPFRWLLPNC